MLSGDVLGWTVLVGVSLLAAAGVAHAQNASTAPTLPTVEVIGTQPLPVLGTPIEQVPANVQTATGAQLRRQQSTNLADFLGENLPGVNVVDMQSNPFQPDVSFRGFTASSALGTPQGLSVFQDGVRINEPFGDVVHWDLIPPSSIASVTLVPGTNPVFGLNTLGGALSVVTKNGFRYPGTSAQAYAGSFGRRSAELETGGHSENADYFVTANTFNENGWRDHSPSDVKQLFGRAGWRNDMSDVAISYNFADTDLTGNGPAPLTLLQRRRASVFTFPDITRNRLDFINGTGSHWFGDSLLLAGNAYSRQLKTRTFNGDLNDAYVDVFDAFVAPGGACAGDPDPRACAAAALVDQSGANHRTVTDERRHGIAGQLTYFSAVAGRTNQLTAGATYDSSHNDFFQTAQDAAITSERGTVATGAETLETSLAGTSRTYSLYATDTYSITRTAYLTLSGRYDRTRVALDDRLGTALDGTHGFGRFNPAVGINVTPNPRATWYAGYSEGSRAPTAIELGCADPNAPCKLPNALASDPPLEQVVAKTWEAGVRGKHGDISWSAALYRTTLHDDIQFVASTASGAGFFDNVGETRREGAEFRLEGRHGWFEWSASYSYVDATFQSPITLLAENNSTADANGFITVEPGDRLPLVPRHTLKFDGEFRATHAWAIGANVVAVSDQFVRGNENNAHQGNGTDFLGDGQVSGYAIVNLHTRYMLTDGWELFARVDNLFDKKYATGGLLGLNPFDADGRFQADPNDWRHETFFSPGAPFGLWIGVRCELGAPGSADR
jgi:iron complex outermembrane recepter protein